MFCVCKVWQKFQSIQVMVHLSFQKVDLTHNGDGIFSMLSKIYVFSKETKTGIEKSTFHASVKSHTTCSPQTLYQIHQRYCWKNTFLTQMMYCNALNIKENVGVLLYALKIKRPNKPKLSVFGPNILFLGIKPSLLAACSSLPGSNIYTRTISKLEEQGELRFALLGSRLSHSDLTEIKKNYWCPGFFLTPLKNS